MRHVGRNRKRKRPSPDPVAQRKKQAKREQAVRSEGVTVGAAMRGVPVPAVTRPEWHFAADGETMTRAIDEDM